MSKNEIEVLIVGAGPTGLTMAIELARRNIPFRIIDKGSTASVHSKALAIHAKTLEIFYSMGLASEFFKHGHKVNKLNAYINQEPRLALSFNYLTGTPFPYVLVIPQSETEKILTKHLESMGCTIEHKKELVQLTAKKDYVEAVIQEGKKQEKINANWLIGCDGPHSKVRQELDLPFSGCRYDEQFLLADGELETQLASDQGHLFLEEFPIALIPMPQNQWRIISTYPSHFALPKTPEVKKILQEQLDKATPETVKIKSLGWTSVFAIHRRIVSKMRHKRVFLAGDAAHIHSPIGGQGMNTGIQDAYNLGWKLAAHIQGNVEESFLDSYQAERYPVAAGVLHGTNVAMKTVMAHSSWVRKTRDFIAPLVLNIPYAQKHIQELVSEIAINYRTSPIVYHQDSKKDWAIIWLKSKIRCKLQSGDRAPNAQLSKAKTYDRLELFSLTQKHLHTLLLFLGDEPKKFPYYAKYLEATIKQHQNWMNGYVIINEHAIDYNLLESVTQEFYLDRNGQAHKVYGCEKPSLCLIRPDGYVAYLESADEEEKFTEFLHANYRAKA